jgi:hypothetical protein
MDIIESHYKPVYRLTVGAILVGLGFNELAFFSISFYVSLAVGQSIFIYVGLIAFEVPLIVIGIISLQKEKTLRTIFGS